MIWTVCLLIKGDQICLPMKKRGHGVGKLNGTGGKPEKNETLENCVKRETKEELEIELIDITKVAEIEFINQNEKSHHYCTAYISRNWIGEPIETEEMKPQWCPTDNIPFDLMWSADRIWIPLVLDGQLIKATFEYSEGDNMINHNINIL